MNFRGGVLIPPDKQLQFMDSWIPVTPEKPIPTRSHPIPADRLGNQLGTPNWHLAGFSNGYAEEVQNCNGFVQNLNPIGQVVQNGGCYGYDGGLAEKTRMIDHILLLMQNADFLATANRGLNRSVNIASERPLIPNSRSQVDCSRRQNHSGTLFLNNQNHHSGYTPLSNLANTPLIPNMHSQVENGRDSYLGSLFLSNQNHYSGSKSVSNVDSFSQIPQNGFLVPHQPYYDLNSPPTETDAVSGVTDTLQFRPITLTPDQVSKLENNQLSATLDITRNEISSYEKDKETLVTSTGNQVPQQHSDELLQSIVDSSPAAISTLHQENKDSEKGDLGIDLNKTPQQKPPRRRKHRPKVITEGKPKRTRKPATPKATAENPTGKRKYVRKNVRKEPITEHADATRGTTDPKDGTAIKSCRRILNFDLEKTRDDSQGTVDGQQELQHRNQRTFILNSDTQATQLCSGTYSVKSAVQIDQQNELMVEYQPPGTISNLTPSMNPLQTDYRSLQEWRASVSQLATTKDRQIEDLRAIERNVEKGYTNPTQNRCRNGFTPIQQQIHAEGMDQVVFQAKTNCESIEKAMSTPQPVLNFQSNLSAARGYKRQHSHTTEHMHPSIKNPMGSLLCQEISQVHECHRNGCIVSTGFSESHKKKKNESGFHTNISGMHCVTAVEDGWGKVRAKHGHDTNANDCTTKMNHEILNSYLESNKIALRLSEVNKFTTDRTNHSMSARNFLPMQQFSSELHSHTERMGETNSLTLVQSFPSLAAIQDRNLHQQSPPKQVPELENGQLLQTSGVKSARRNKKLKNQDANYDHQKSSAKTQGPPAYHTPIDEITYKMEGLHLNEGSNKLIGQEHKALILYKGDGALVPYGEVEFLKKRKPRPKVDLDPETNRLWNLLMGQGTEGLDGTDKEKEKWWEEERKVFRGRADSFIARMHLVQGDRRFSRWKGSVVDSVIGVFLTQNVSDHLSSSAFMSLAARFPLKSTSNNRTCDNIGTDTLVEESEVCIINQDDTTRCLEKVSSQTIYNGSYMAHHELTEHQRDNETTGIERRSLMDAHSQSMEEEVISSQDSFDSSIIQGTGGLRSSSGSNSEAEDFINGGKHSEVYFPTLTNLLQMEKTTFQEFYSHENSCPLMDEGSRYGHKQSEYVEHGQKKSRLDRDDSNGPSAFTYPNNPDNLRMQVQVAASDNYHSHMIPDSRVPEVEDFEALSEESISPWSSTAKDANGKGFKTKVQERSGAKNTVQQNGQLQCQDTPRMGPYVQLINHSEQQESISQPVLHTVHNQPSCHNHQHDMKALQLQTPSFTEPVQPADALAKSQNNAMQHVLSVPKLTETAERTSVVNKQIHLENGLFEPNSNGQAYSSVQAYGGTNAKISKAKKGKVESEKKSTFDWDSLRMQVPANSRNNERSRDALDSLDYEAVRCANVLEISNAIKERGMNNMLAERIKAFLNRVVRDHGSIDLEWLRDVPPDKAKDYLLSIRGLGLKSVECVRLLTLHHLAFPVDTNVGRIAVRLGWVPLQPLPESLQLHLLELYPMLESIQKYLWPRLCKLDQRTLYELHYQLITFGKVFCTKSKPNCNACPMRGECRHFASAFASARLALPGPEEKSIVSSSVPIATERNPAVVINPMQLPPPENNSLKVTGYESRTCEPIIEEPATPEQECTEATESDIEDAFYEDPDEIPIIKLNIKEFTTNLQNYMQENMELQEGDMSKALVAINPSIPTPKLKNVSRLRTEHQVYELPDSHPLLEGMDRREPDDPSPYLLAIWTPGETANSIQPPERTCGSQEPNKLCNEKTCFSCNSVREANAQTVRGTLLIPCRTAMRGSFPLNGTYFQVNEVFADNESSQNPIDVPRSWLWNLPRRTVYFGTSVSTIFKGLSTEGIQYCFWKGFVCVRGFDQKTRAPRPLKARLHYPASKLVKTKNENKR
ncbi:transcriptional activator DEMETER isoform X2 [Quercus suber]|uniref:transcriptional activator DEMETER isoform X2 n=1 Tax=Quercus suber TaxID=58331 RepID=UPI0032DE4A1D